jgi:hypothetical protein
VLSGPVISPPTDVNEHNVLSSMITILPHNWSPVKHILVCFPINKEYVKDWSKIQLMYSNTSNTEKPYWVNLQQNNTTKHSDAICWFISDGYCFLYVKHFCRFFCAQGSNLMPQQAIYVTATLHSKYADSPSEQKLSMTVGFHCNNCHSTLLDKKVGIIIISGIRKYPKYVLFHYVYRIIIVNLPQIVCHCKNNYFYPIIYQFMFTLFLRNFYVFFTAA